MIRSKKLKSVLLISLCLWLACDVTDPDTTPPSVTVTTPVTDSIVSDEILITAIAEDNIDIEKVMSLRNSVN